MSLSDDSVLEVSSEVVTLKSSTSSVPLELTGLDSVGAVPLDPLRLPEFPLEGATSDTLEVPALEPAVPSCELSMLCASWCLLGVPVGVVVEGANTGWELGLVTMDLGVVGIGDGTGDGGGPDCASGVGCAGDIGDADGASGPGCAVGAGQVVVKEAICAPISTPLNSQTGKGWILFSLATKSGHSLHTVAVCSGVGGPFCAMKLILDFP